MCGIAGIFRTGGDTTPADRAAVERMAAAETHRGPDDAGMFQDARIVLGHRRLSIIDLSPTGHQPMSNEDGAVWVTYNGEIYNYAELAAELPGHRFVSRCDTEVLLHGYEEWGIDGLLRRLRGMFAFAMYDNRGPQPLCLLARDRLGIKPLYYVARPDSIAFASEVKALVVSGLVPNRKNLTAMAGLLLLGSVPAPATGTQGVKCLLPGHYLVAGGGGVTTRKYWEPDAPAEPGSASALREALADAVNRHLVGDVPVGVFLSGGVDSAALVALASRATSSLATLTVVFDEREFSEGAEARRIAQQFGTDHREVRVTSQDFMRELPNVLRVMDQPTNDGVNTYFVSRAARQAGLTVVLSGLGGDEVFGGYKHYRWLARHGNSIRRFSALPGFLRRTVLSTAVGYGRARGRENWMRLSSLAEGVSDAGLYLALRGFFAPEQVRALLDVNSSEVREAAGEYLDGARDSGSVATGPAFRDAFRKMEMRRYLHDQLLRDTDVFSMAHSIEVRVPYLDHIVVGQASGLSSLPARAAGNKPLLTEAAGEPAVFEAARRSKRGFSFPFGKWMRSNSGELREMALAGGCLNRGAIGKLWNEFDRGRLHWSRAWMLAVIGAGK
ncbi:MAG TPA: asparagine synthase (glutamine-hydrolyzing) [Bryobacteraceae bacterium]|jgi:asparagine synthase (glutamine-hydrolysing)|nr:asparagine synthase (glutamine-hydrolyzing) [Bryobacteraceae bacterium]